MFEKNIEKAINSTIVEIENEIKNKFETPDLGIPEIGIAGIVGVIQTIITKLNNKKIISDDIIESILNLLEKRLNEKILPNLSSVIADMIFEIIEKVIIKSKERKNKELIEDIILLGISMIPKILNDAVRNKCINLKESQKR